MPVRTISCPNCGKKEDSGRVSYIKIADVFNDVIADELKLVDLKCSKCGFKIEDNVYTKGLKKLDNFEIIEYK